MRLRLLRILLFFSAIAWGVSVVGVIVPWSTAVGFLQGLGLAEVPHDPMLDYWLRMASGAFFLVGVLFLLFALNPIKYANVIPLFGGLMIIEGIVLLVHGIRLHLPPFPFYADTAACLMAGMGIIYLQRNLSRD